MSLQKIAGMRLSSSRSEHLAQRALPEHNDLHNQWEQG
jgi:hypothetical protein